jgi:ABC-type transporter Mla MlaB component
MNAPVSFGLMERLIQRRTLGRSAFFLTNTLIESTIHVLGDVDRSNVSEFEHEIRSAARRVVRVTVDLTFCSYVDLAAIRALISSRKRLGKRFGIVPPQRLGLRNILEFAGL